MGGSPKKPINSPSMTMWWERHSSKAYTVVAATLLLLAAYVCFSATTGLFSFHDKAGRRKEGFMMMSAYTNGASTSSCPTCSVRLYQGVVSPTAGGENNRLEAEINRMRATVATPSPDCDAKVDHVILDTEEQESFLKEHGMECFTENADDNAGIMKKNKNYNPVPQKYNELMKNDMTHLAHELWKYCALSLPPSLHGDNGNDAETSVAYLDVESPLLGMFSDLFLQSSSSKRRNYAVLGSHSYFPGTMHGSFLFLTPSNRRLGRTMVRLIMETDSNILNTSPLLIPTTLHSLVEDELLDAEDESSFLKSGVYAGKDGDEWVLMEQRCHSDLFSAGAPGSDTGGEDESLPLRKHRVTHQCPSQRGFCCDISDPSLSSVALLTRHPLLPYQLLPPQSLLPHPYELDKYNNAGSDDIYREVVFNEENLPFISTIREEVFSRPDGHMATPNLFDTLHANQCLPTSIDCHKCLRQKEGANCDTCKSQCKCYCKNLCHVKVEEKHVSKTVYVTPPAYSKDPSRIVPRIVHQTWFEPVTKEKYPNMSRLIESWKQSGWEYRFYDDDAAISFIAMHFPPEVLEAYNAIKPGAFKADLFRYCALLINGGVYADMDVLLETNLDAIISGDVGFMIPMDEPGIEANQRFCLWNGLLAVAPGHPFLAKVIEVVVNSIRNRFTSVDYDNLLCPTPDLSVSHRFDTLFTSGPCILGYAINKLLENHPQQQFEAGEIEHNNSLLGIPGRTIILNQDKRDMGAHRFTWLEKNLVFAATDLPDYDDRKKLGPGEEDNHKHYSETHVRKAGIYGLKDLYIDRKSADENIKIVMKDRVGRIRSPTRNN